jgi:hypothetical protein
MLYDGIGVGICGINFAGTNGKPDLRRPAA